MAEKEDIESHIQELHMAKSMRLKIQKEQPKHKGSERNKGSLGLQQKLK